MNQKRLWPHLVWRSAQASPKPIESNARPDGSGTEGYVVPEAEEKVIPGMGFVPFELLKNSTLETVAVWEKSATPFTLYVPKLVLLSLIWMLA